MKIKEELELERNQQIEKLYIFRDADDVRQFLVTFPLLVQILLDTYEQIQLIFPKSRVFLEVVVDYEANNKEVFLSVATTLPAEEAMKMLQEFYMQWWFKASKDAKGKISIGLELGNEVEPHYPVKVSGFGPILSSF